MSPSSRRPTGASTPSNTFIKKKGHVQKVTFDEDARREYLTGFHKRNVQKKETKRKRAEERQRQERLELRKQHRQGLAERAAANAKAVEKALGMVESDAEISVNSGNEDALLRDQELEYENDEKLAVVTVVDDFSIDSLRHGDDQIHDHPQTDPNPRNKILSPVDSSSVTKETAKPRTHKVKYETKTARSAEKARQRARKIEKAQWFRDKSKKQTRH